MRNILVCLIMAIGFMASPLYGQFSLFGTVWENEESLEGAIVKVVAEGIGLELEAESDAVGFYHLDNLPAGRYKIALRLDNVLKLEQELLLTGTTELNFSLDGEYEQIEGTTYKLPEIAMIDLRAQETNPVTYTIVGKEEIAENNVGVDLPYLLNLTPSVVVSSDAGTGIGYTGIWIRGSDPTRTNVTINGIPLNDSESQGTFWVDLPDFASSAQDIQIQRGVGTSTHGAGSFGATVDMQTAAPSRDPYTAIGGSYGSFGTWKSNLQLGTGLLNDHWSFDGRLSKIHSDGFIDRARADLSSWYTTSSYVDEKQSLRLNVFSGHEETYQAWNGVPLSELNGGNRTYNPSGDRGDGTFHDNEVDNYRQTHSQLHYSRDLGNQLQLKTALHYTKGKGYFEQYKVGEGLSDYGLNNALLDSLGIEETDLIRRRWLDNDFYGMTFRLAQFREKINWMIGGAVNNYEGGHFGEVIWSRYAGDSEIGQRYYDNEGNKLDWNIYGRTEYSLNSKLHAYIDLQFRGISYEFLGLDNDGSNITQDVSLQFFNPKIGLSYFPNRTSKAYVYLGVANREPNRSDFTESTPLSRPEHESLYDLELGYQTITGPVQWSANIYYMLYKNQLALDGGVNDVGEYTRINIDDSYRRGIELVADWKISEKINWTANATFSQNKVSNF
ncbi:TonB-dependent receptor, partial [Chitinophagales bacterium]|nr:TonB-dependent receptor [Chitinophagales bacterium]